MAKLKWNDKELRKLVGEAAEPHVKAKTAEIKAAAFDYQSECHCSKTAASCSSVSARFDYQSECHCSKTFSCIRPCSHVP